MTTTEALRRVWAALHDLEDCLPVNAQLREEWADEWDDICLAMAVLHEELEVDHDEI